MPQIRLPGLASTRTVDPVLARKRASAGCWVNLARLPETPATACGKAAIRPSTLLDEWRGFHTYTTWSTTTFANAETLLAEAGASAARIGVIRCYMTRLARTEAARLWQGPG